MSDFLENVVNDQGASALRQVMEPVQAYLALLKKISEKETELATMKAQALVLCRNTIPDLLLSNGLDNLRLANGIELSVKDELDISVPKEDEEKKKKVLAFIASHGGADIIKETVSFTDPDDAVKQYLAENGFVITESKEVNSNSLKAWARGKLGLKAKTVATLESKDFPPEANLFLYRKTILKGEEA